jgi:hypothetical protein
MGHSGIYCPKCGWWPGRQNKPMTSEAKILWIVALTCCGCPSGLLGACFLAFSNGSSDSGNLQSNVLPGIGLLLIPALIIALYIKFNWRKQE